MKENGPSAYPEKNCRNESLWEKGCPKKCCCLYQKMCHPFLVLISMTPVLLMQCLHFVCAEQFSCQTIPRISNLFPVVSLPLHFLEICCLWWPLRAGSQIKCLLFLANLGPCHSPAFILGHDLCICPIRKLRGLRWS